jgi:hypothetical protein
MSTFNRWNLEPDVVPQGEEFLASSEKFPGVYGEGETREEAIDSFWEMVDFIGELARAPDWPHDRTPYVDEWETAGDGALPSDDDDDDDDALPPWKAEDADGDLPPWNGEPWKAE